MDCKTRVHKDVHQEANTLLQHSSPSSSSSSPNHEFSFTISLHSVPDNRASFAPHHASSIAVDLSPADDIFFHGHLLPLHLISHLPPASPRSSTTSIETFSFPDHHHPIPNQKQSVNGETESRARRESHNSKPRKPFSLFGLSKWRKGFEAAGDGDRSKVEAKQKSKKLKFDVTHVIKRYARMVRPLVFFRRSSNKENDFQFHRQPPCSFSGDLTGFSNSNVFSKKEAMMGRGGRGESYSSAPASMRTSPTNSGLLVATTALPNCSTTDSTMEELQAAIQAAIAHCKNSIATEEKRKCHD